MRYISNPMGRGVSGVLAPRLTCMFSAFGVASTVTLSAAMAQADRAADAKPPNRTWSGSYMGGTLGDNWGHAAWSTQGAPSIHGAFDYYHPYDAFTGEGSYSLGLRAGRNWQLPAGVVLGIEADMSAPSSIAGARVFSTPASGTASYADKVELSGSLRGRLGYLWGDWLLYGSGGLAWSMNSFTRTQIAGGTLAPDTEELKRSRVRTGWTAGAGVEVPIAPQWTASAEYMFSAFGPYSVTFPASAERFQSDLSLHSVRVGLNYQFGEGGAEADKLKSAPNGAWAIHGQTTYVHQYALPFKAPYRGDNSLQSNQSRETWDVAFFVGTRLWHGAELWFNPEIDQGFGLSNTLGLAGFSSGAAYKVGADYPYARLHRTFIRQTINLGGETEKVEAGPNQMPGTQTTNRVVITAGKFSTTDIFDTNKYANNPRTDFLNWAVLNTGSFDYAADAWAFTYGAAVEWYQGPWTLRGGVFDLSITPNSTKLDPTFQQFQLVVEIERRYQLFDQPGKLAGTVFLSRGRMANLREATAIAEQTGLPADPVAVRRYQGKSGVAFNLEQQFRPEIGLFARFGMTTGDTEAFDFTDIDRTLTAGLVFSGKLWGRPDDTLGIAGVVNNISAERKAYFNAGGLGILAGDGKLPNPGPERIFETYYSFPLLSWRGTVDYQFVENPAYNRDRGPVSVIATRLRTQF